MSVVKATRCVGLRIEPLSSEIGAKSRNMRSLRLHYQSYILNIDRNGHGGIPSSLSVLTYLYSQNQTLDNCSCLLCVNLANSSYRGQFREVVKECGSTGSSRQQKKPYQSAPRKCPKSRSHTERVIELMIRAVGKTNKHGGGRVCAAPIHLMQELHSSWPNTPSFTSQHTYWATCLLESRPICIIDDQIG